MQKGEKRRKPRKTEPGVLFCPAPSPASLAHKSGKKEDERLESAQRERQREKKKYSYLSRTPALAPRRILISRGKKEYFLERERDRDKNRLSPSLAPSPILIYRNSLFNERGARAGAERR